MRMASNVKTNNDIKKIIKWAEAMKTKGIFPSSTAFNRIKSLNRLASILGVDESKDPKSLLEGLEDIAHRWATKTSATPKSATITKSHAKRLLEDYIEYQKDPAGFKPRGRRRRPKKEIAKIKVTAEEKKKIKKKPEAEHEEGVELQRPSLNINIQIHISAETSEKQIDKIFESMAKYIPFKKT